MKKKIYSLVLSEEIVAAVDRMAYSLHTSRSNLINQILAEQLSCTTPEMKIQTVFSGMEALAEQFRVLEQSSAYIRAMQSQLDYKYKPTVQYSIELYRTPRDGQEGCLRVQLRTRNAALLEVLEEFFGLWIVLESRYVSANGEALCRRTAPGRLERVIRNPGIAEETLGELIGEYVSTFDRYLKAWFTGIAHPQQTAQKLEAAFRQDMQDRKHVI